MSHPDDGGTEPASANDQSDREPSPMRKLTEAIEAFQAAGNALNSLRRDVGNVPMENSADSGKARDVAGGARAPTGSSVEDRQRQSEPMQQQDVDRAEETFEAPQDPKALAYRREKAREYQQHNSPRGSALAEQAYKDLLRSKALRDFHPGGNRGVLPKPDAPEQAHSRAFTYDMDCNVVPIAETHILDLSNDRARALRRMLLAMRESIWKHWPNKADEQAYRKRQDAAETARLAAMGARAFGNNSSNVDNGPATTESGEMLMTARDFWCTNDAKKVLGRMGMMTVWLLVEFDLVDWCSDPIPHGVFADVCDADWIDLDRDENGDPVVHLHVASSDDENAGDDEANTATTSAQAKPKVPKGRVPRPDAAKGTDLAVSPFDPDTYSSKPQPHVPEPIVQAIAEHRAKLQRPPLAAYESGMQPTLVQSPPAALGENVAPTATMLPPSTTAQDPGKGRKGSSPIVTPAPKVKKLGSMEQEAELEELAEMVRRRARDLGLPPRSGNDGSEGEYPPTERKGDHKAGDQKEGTQ